MSDRSPLLLKLREMILSGKFPPGQRLAEVRIAEMLGVSRTPVRSALATLAPRGLVVPGRGLRGFQVRTVTLKEVLDATELRGVLEGVRGAASRRGRRQPRPSRRTGRQIAASSVIFVWKAPRRRKRDLGGAERALSRRHRSGQRQCAAHSCP